MELHEVIQKAIDGGWDGKNKPTDYCMIDPALFLDPKWWQALGKAMGWDKEITAYITFDKGKENNESWRLHWHQLIDHLAEGKSISDYFKNL